MFEAQAVVLHYLACQHHMSLSTCCILLCIFGFGMLIAFYLHFVIILI